MGISNTYGPPVEGINFYGRTKELAQAKEMLMTRHSIRLSAPRHIGKSSLAIRLIEEMKAEGWDCVYIDLEGVRTEDKFLEKLFCNLRKANLWENIATNASKLWEKIDKISLGLVSLNLEESADTDYYSALENLLELKKDTLIVMDELPLFLNILSKSDDGINRVTFILNWLRSLRQRSQTKVRWLLCGSIGLGNFTAALNLSYAINDLAALPLDEMSREEAIGLMEQLSLARDIKLSEDIIDYTLKKIGWNIPYFLQIIFSKLTEIGYSREITPKDVDNAYDALCSMEYLYSWAGRLDEYREYQELAMMVLKALSTTKEGLEKSILLSVAMNDRTEKERFKVEWNLSNTLMMLESDGYILCNGTKWMFKSHLIQDFWQKYL